MSTIPQPQPVPQSRPVLRCRSLRDRLLQAKAKQREDLIRFRTCCADPRASR